MVDATLYSVLYWPHSAAFSVIAVKQQGLAGITFSSFPLELSPFDGEAPRVDWSPGQSFEVHSAMGRESALVSAQALSQAVAPLPGVWTYENYRTLMRCSIAINEAVMGGFKAGGAGGWKS